jgi:hypothetical protein
VRKDFNIFPLFDKRRHYIGINSVTWFDAPPQLNLVVQLRCNLVLSNSTVVHPHTSGGGGGSHPILSVEPHHHLEPLGVFKVLTTAYQGPSDFSAAIKSYLLHEINQKENHIEFFLDPADFGRADKQVPEGARFAISYSLYRL